MSATYRERRRAVFAFVVILAPCPAAIAAEIYKWVDETGRTQYSATKPATARTTTVNVTSQAPAPATEAGTASSNPAEPARAAGAHCTPSLCRLVLTVEPDCNSSWCQLADRTADDCQTILCQKARNDVKRHVERQQVLARERARPAPPPVGGIAKRMERQEAAAQDRERALVEKCKANHGIGCDNPEVIRELKKQDTALTPEQRQQALAQRRRREQEEHHRAPR
jgi:hypothetical protein